MRRHHHAARASWHVRLVVLALCAVGLWPLGLVRPAAAYVDYPQSWKVIAAPGGMAQVVTGQQGELSFNGLVFLTQACDPAHGCNEWEQSQEYYIGPQGRAYFTYRNLHNHECLSHTAGMLITEPCVWANESQWWSIQAHTFSNPCPPSSPLCLPTSSTQHLFSPWDKPYEVATSEYGLLILHPRVGTLGSPAQHLLIYHQPKAPW